jgi:RNA polymerase sigma-70 factor (sigma-E family)
MSSEEDMAQTEHSEPAWLVESFDEFYRRERSSVVGLAFVLSGSRVAADDLTQEAFVAAYRRWDVVGAYRDPAAWVRRVVANASVSRWRRAKSEAKAVLLLGAGRQHVVPEMSADVLDVWDAVRALPKRQAQCIALHYKDGRSVAEIAEILDCSEGTVKTHLSRGREALSFRLEGGTS